MRKPENTFIAGVHRHLRGTYHLKMHNPYTAGVPDVWYSGDRGDMWVEYKWLPRIPVRASHVRPDLSALQLEWLNCRCAEGRMVHVIVGCKAGGVWFGKEEWERGKQLDEFRRCLQPRQDIAAAIYNHCGAKCSSSTGSFSLLEL